MSKFSSFKVSGTYYPVSFVETMQVKDGVVCDVYQFNNDDSRDLAVVTVAKGCKTPLQKILQGEKTIEGYLRGSGQIAIQSGGKIVKKLKFSSGDQQAEVEVVPGQLMQWTADVKTDLVFYEVCTPSYEDGRFENLPE